jgi:Ring finger domain
MKDTMTALTATRITTICVGRLCIGYRSPIGEHPGEPDYTAVVSVFVTAFFVIWIALVMLMLFGEFLRQPLSFMIASSDLMAVSSSDVPAGARDAVVKEIFKRRSRVEEACPMSICVDDRAEDVCAVCLDVVAIGSFCRQLPCSHRFHVACIDQWVLQGCGGQFDYKARCPICKASAELVGSGDRGCRSMLDGDSTSGLTPSIDLDSLADISDPCRDWALEGQRGDAIV